MPKSKQHVFSARTTEGGLRRLNELKEKLHCSWDDLVIDAINAYHGVNIPKVPKKERPPKAERKEKKAKAEKRDKAGKAKGWPRG